MKRHLVSKSVLFLFVICVFSCRKDVVDRTRADNDVWLQEYAFNPLVLSVKVNTTVTWINKDATDHTVTGNSFDSGNLPGGSSYSYTFTTPGTFPYKCLYHAPGMTGTIIVQ